MANNETTYPTPSTYTGGATGAGNEGIRDRVSNVTNQAKEKAAEFGRQTADTIDRNLDTAASKLQSTAESLRMRAGTGSDKVSNLATNAADKLDATARYFREHHTRDMVSDFESMVRRNPGASLGAALAVGFLLGATLKRDRY